jgi:hypothetical protein
MYLRVYIARDAAFEIHYGFVACIKLVLNEARLKCVEIGAKYLGISITITKVTLCKTERVVNEELPLRSAAAQS